MPRRKKTKVPYKIEFVDKILDPVHGFIDLTLVEQEIIALPIFKRLQSLKQLSLTNWVFPGAEHTRYMHSLGVMYIVDLMATHLKDVTGKSRFTDEERQLLRLAGLLHDIGHYPLSHVTEYVYIENLTEEEDSLFTHNQKIKSKIDKLGSKSITGEEEVIDFPEYMQSRYSIKMHHETMGTKVIECNDEIKKIINKYCPFVDIQDIQDIIVGCVDRKQQLSAMVQLMHSELDADGIDYVMRDASFSGTSYGGFELGLLLRNLIITDYNGTEIVGVRPKGISIVDQYLVSKYFAYTQVIFNKHVAIFDTMAEMLTKALIKLEKSSAYITPKTLDKYIKAHNTNDEYLKFTDRTFWTQIDNLKIDDLDGIVPDYVTKIYNRLGHYQEFPMHDGREIIMTSNSKDDAYKALKATAMYSELDSKDEQKLILFHKRGFTSQIPERKYRDELKKLYGEECDNELFVRYNTPRLQEGIVVIEKENTPVLLVDDSRSIMSYMYGTVTYILREYFVK